MPGAAMFGVENGETCAAPTKVQRSSNFRTIQCGRTPFDRLLYDGTPRLDQDTGRSRAAQNEEGRANEDYPSYHPP